MAGNQAIAKEKRKRTNGKKKRWTRAANGYMRLRYRVKDCDRIRRGVEAKQRTVWEGREGDGLLLFKRACESTGGVVHPGPRADKRHSFRSRLNMRFLLSLQPLFTHTEHR